MGIKVQMNLVRQIWSERNDVRRRAVFVDRDGTLIVHRDIVASLSDVVLLPSVTEGLQKLKEAGYLLIGISNQPNIKKGVVTEEATRKVNDHLQSLLQADGAELDAMYSCPHRYGSNCLCRKPDQGLLLAAQEDFVIDMSQSWFIGDTGRDMETGKRAHLKTIYINSNESVADNHFTTEGDFTVENFMIAERQITNERSDQE